MSSAAESRNVIRFILQIISQIADYKYQRRIWVNGEGPEVDSFDDTVNDYCPIGSYIVRAPEEYEISEVQLKALRLFHEKFEAFADDNDYPELFIDTPEWKEIMGLADKVLDAFGWSKETRKFV